MKVIYHINLRGAQGPGLIFEQIRQALEESGVTLEYKHFSNENPIKADREVAKEIEKCDLFIGGFWGFLSQIRKAKKMGAKVLSLRFSTHPLYRQRVLRDLYASHGQNPSGTELYRVLREFDESDYFLTLSEFSKHTYVLNGIDDDKVFVVPPGIDTGFFNCADQNTDFKVFFNGTNAIRKGVFQLLKAWEELDIEGELVLHSGLTKPKVKNVRCITDWVTREELKNLYHESSVSVLPSFEEGFAGTNFESMACGRPIIATNITGIEDVMTNYKEGILIPPNNIKAIKEAILYFYENREELTRMGINARKKAEEYPWSRFRKGVAGVVKRILEK